MQKQFTRTSNVFILSRRPSQSKLQVYKKQSAQTISNTKSCLSLNTTRSSSCTQQSTNIQSLKYLDDELILNSKIAKKQQLIYFYIQEQVRRRKEHLSNVKQRKKDYQRTLENLHSLIDNESSRNNALTRVLQQLQQNKKIEKKEQMHHLTNRIPKYLSKGLQIKIQPRVLSSIDRNSIKNKREQVMQMGNALNKYLYNGGQSFQQRPFGIKEGSQNSQIIPNTVSITDIQNRNETNARKTEKKAEKGQLKSHKSIFDLSGLNWSRVQGNENLEVTLNLSNSSELLIM